MTSEPIRLGVIGLGRGFMLTLPALRDDPRVALVAACARQPAQRARFEAEFGGRAYADPDAFFADPQVEAVYVATPHALHVQHTAAAARAGKHVLVEKPMAVSMADAETMVRACDAAQVRLIVGPSHSFDAPVAQARALIAGGSLGRPRMIHAFNYTDFLYRPRRPEELRTEEGGGVVFSQAVHQVDVVRALAGSMARQVCAATGAWDQARPTEGAYAALIGFDDGLFAALVYSGYGRFDSDEWMGWTGELGHDKDPEAYGTARRVLNTAESTDTESGLKRGRAYGVGEPPAPANHHEHFGPIIVGCERGDIRLTPDGMWLYRDGDRTFDPAPRTGHPRTAVVDALVGALRDGLAPLQTGRWGLASLEICHAILSSAGSRTPVTLERQVPAISEGDEP